MESKATRTSESLDQLAEGVSALTSSDAWMAHLATQARFHRYSFGNCVLIADQRPDATQIAGFNAWKQLGRSVRKGEKAIWILAPMVHKTEDGENVIVRGFKAVPVFDVAQTDGGDLPEIPCRLLTGEAPDRAYDALLSVARDLDFAVLDVELPGTVNGNCSHAAKTIQVKTSNAPAQRTKTLAHELAHAILHEVNPNRPLGEMEAESVAYVVCSAIGIDSSDYSFGYLASWVGGDDQAIAALKASGARIQRAAHQILASLESLELVVA